MTPTLEQSAIIATALTTNDNLLINALAGAAKTTTLCMLATKLPVVPMLSLAFNKRIAEEMQARLPGHVRAATLNSIGHQTWGTVIGRRPALNTNKVKDFLKSELDKLSRDDRDEAYANFSETLQAISTARRSGYVPPNYTNQTPSLISRTDFLEFLDEDIDIHFIDSVLSSCIKAAYAGSIDFDDQIYMPTLFGGAFPRFPVVMVDEAQDLSLLNHKMLEKICFPTSRLIAVGDPWQSIYLFRGAMRSGMARLRETFNMTEMTLSVSFRCPKAIVARARNRVPHFQWAEHAVEGEIIQFDNWTADEVPEAAAIICRNNAPLFSLAFKLLRARRGVNLIGTDIGPSLVRTLRKLGPLNMSRADLVLAIERWKSDKLRKGKNPDAATDRAEAFEVFANEGQTLADAITFAEALFEQKGPIALLSGHKAKGLEWNHVIHLDPWRIPSKYAETEAERDQELNIRYVIETRSKQTLILADLEKFYGA